MRMKLLEKNFIVRKTNKEWILIMKMKNKPLNIRSIKWGIITTSLFINTLFDFTLPQSKDVVNLWLGYTVHSFREINPSDASAAVKVYAESFKDRIAKRYQKPAAFISTIYESDAQVEEAFQKDQLDMLSLNTDEYFRLQRKFHIYPYLAAATTDNPFERYVLIVRNDLKITTPNDLKGKRLSIPNPDFNPILNDWLYNYLINNNMPDADKVFSQIKIFDKESNSVYEVFFKKADCTIIREKVFTTLGELNPQLMNSLSIFASSKPMVLTFVAANAASDQKLLSTILEEISDFHLTASGKNILNIFKAKKWVRVYEKDLASVKQILDENAASRKNAHNK